MLPVPLNTGFTVVSQRVPVRFCAPAGADLEGTEALSRDIRRHAAPVRPVGLYRDHLEFSTGPASRGASIRIELAQCVNQSRYIGIIQSGKTP